MRLVYGLTILLLFHLFSYGQEDTVNKSEPVIVEEEGDTEIKASELRKKSDKSAVTANDSEKYKTSGIAVSPSHLRYTITPGKEATKIVKVTNDTEKLIKFKVSFFDFNMNGKGKSQFIKPGTGEYSLSKWISVAPNFIELEPGEREEISVTVKVPNDDSGRRAAWCAMMIEQVEERKTLDPEKSDDGTIAFGIIPIINFGVFIYQNPPNVTVNSVEITDFKYTIHKTKHYLTLEVENNGDGISYSTAYVDLINLNTGKQQKLLVKKFTIVPGLIRDFTFELPEGLESGGYSAVGVLDFGSNEEIRAAELEFSIP